MKLYKFMVTAEQFNVLEPDTINVADYHSSAKLNIELDEETVARLIVMGLEALKKKLDDLPIHNPGEKIEKTT